MVSNTGYGHSGPWSDFGAMATALEPTHGTGAFMGYLEQNAEGRLVPGSIPNKIANSYTDFLASWTAQLAVMASLFHRARTGQGMWIDMAMYQVGVSFIGEGLLDYAFNGRRTRRLGNRHESMSPHGCYPCQGTDEWVVIAVRDDVEWRSFCEVLQRPELAKDSRFADPITRHQNQDELDSIIRLWTSEQSSHHVMDLLQNLGVPAGPVLNAKQMLADPHLRARGYFEPVYHPDESGLGRREYIGRGWKLSDAEIRIRKSAPLLGADNHYVLSQVLGMGKSEIEELRSANAIGQTLAGAATPASVPLDRQAELGWIVEYDPEYKQFLADVENRDSSQESR
jgi:crotonobetainyl-CoA:carnitine CoA-transferase CaiB-like acyl-CoA transferase